MNFPQPRILIFSSSYAPVVGGVQTVTHNLAKELIDSGYEVRVVTSRYPISLPKTANLDGVRVDRLMLMRPQVDQLKRNRPDLFLASLYYGPESLLRLRKIFEEFQPDIVNVHFPDRQIAPILKLRRERKFRLIVSLHGHDVEQFVNGKGLQIGPRRRSLRDLQEILREADAVTAVSQDLMAKATLVETSISAKSFVIHNGIDLTRFTEKVAYSHPRAYILGVGRLIYKKGFDLLIDAYARYQCDAKPDLIIAGTGDEFDALSRQVKDLGLEKNIHFFGEASAQEVTRLMNGSIGVVVPSRVEPFGIVALEALAAGKPLVAAKVGGLAELLTELNEPQSDGEGHPKGVTRKTLLVEPTIDGLTDGLGKMLELSRNNGLSGAGLPEKFTWPQVARSYERVLVGY